MNLHHTQGMNPGLRLKGLLSKTPNLTDLLPGVTAASVVHGSKVGNVHSGLWGRAVQCVLLAEVFIFHDDDDGSAVAFLYAESALQPQLSSIGDVPPDAAVLRLASLVEDAWLTSSAGRQVRIHPVQGRDATLGHFKAFARPVVRKARAANA